MIASTLRKGAFSLAIFAVLQAAACAGEANSAGNGRDSKGGTYIDRGRYLVRIAGCNDCHTAGYAQSGGTIPEKDWLKGDSLGWSGPWGTTYPANLRLYMAKISEEQWVGTAHTAQLRPPMPWFALRDMSTEDLRAIYRYVRHLGPDGQPAPQYVEPGKTPAGPVVRFPG